MALAGRLRRGKEGKSLDQKGEELEKHLAGFCP